jgi:hypothetical protein
MPNPYFTSVDPYQMPEQQGLMPTFQNIGQQQANQQAALAQQNQQVQQAGQTQQQGGMNPLAMAMMLRKKKPEDLNLKGDNTYFGSNSNGMGAGGSADFNQMIGLT